MQNHREKLEVVAQRALDHTKSQSTGEILGQLQDYLHQRASDMRKLFVRYDENGSGRITRAHFKKVGILLNSQKSSFLSGIFLFRRSTYNISVTVIDFNKNHSINPFSVFAKSWVRHG